MPGKDYPVRMIGLEAAFISREVIIAEALCFIYKGEIFRVGQKSNIAFTGLFYAAYSGYNSVAASYHLSIDKSAISFKVFCMPASIRITK